MGRGVLDGAPALDLEGHGQGEPGSRGGRTRTRQGSHLDDSDVFPIWDFFFTRHQGWDDDASGPCQAMSGQPTEHRERAQRRGGGRLANHLVALSRNPCDKRVVARSARLCPADIAAAFSPGKRIFGCIADRNRGFARTTDMGWFFPGGFEGLNKMWCMMGMEVMGNVWFWSLRGSDFRDSVTGVVLMGNQFLCTCLTCSFLSA